eukprot:SM000006S19376  [mRNA]  locus=s6:449037:453672:+ [translate_table: standard]
MAGRFLWLSMWLSVCALLAVQIAPALNSLIGDRAYEQEGASDAIRVTQHHDWVETEEQDDDHMDLPLELLPPSPPPPVIPKPWNPKLSAKLKLELAELRRRQVKLAKLWKKPPDRGYKPCIDPSSEFTAASKATRGFLRVYANGGLNQMRAGICDMVAVARILNATLIVPELDKGSFWQDNSNFSDIFDVEYFIEALKDDVPVLQHLPKQYRYAAEARKFFRSWSPYSYYNEDIAKLWHSYKASFVIRAMKSDSRLANNELPTDIQKLRCRVHYDALRFAPHIEMMGKELVKRMQKQGPYIALHLRYEMDMLAFSGCYHGLSKEEADELTAIRMKTKHWRVKEIDPTIQRAHGFCPLTPKEIGMLLHSMGFLNTTLIYIASGEIYGGEVRMADFRHFFPLIVRKETLLTVEELAPFVDHRSQMAALDYIASVESDLFVPTYSGNMARAVEGHRRFLGHRKTIIPDRKELVALFDKMERREISPGKEFNEAVSLIHMHRQGAPRERKGPAPGTRGKERPRTEEAFYTNPLPDCLCQENPRNLGGKGTGVRRAGGNITLDRNITTVLERLRRGARRDGDLRSKRASKRRKAGGLVPPSDASDGTLPEVHRSRSLLESDEGETKAFWL